MNLADRIRKLRKDNSMTQEQLAEELDVTVGAVYKWESKQALPEIRLLIKMADLFKVSVDSLLGYQVDQTHIETLFEELEEAKEKADIGKIEGICDLLLKDFPNEPKVVQKCIEGYEILHLITSKDVYMNICIEQTQRLFLLNKGEPDIKRIERIKDLANFYEDLKNWEKAKSYYEESNFDKQNNPAIARCLLKMNRYEEALSLVSEHIVDSVYRQYSAVCILADVWNALGNKGNARLACEWMCDMMDKLSYSSVLSKILQLKMLDGKVENKDELISEIKALYQSEKQLYPKAPFLKITNKKPVVLVVSDKEKESLKDVNKDTFTCDLRGE